MNVYEVYEDILNQINKKHLTNYKLGNPLGEGKFVKVFEIFGYKDDDEYVGRFTLKPTTEDSWSWIKTKTEQEYKLLTQKGIQEKYVGKLCKTYTSDEWYFSIQKKYITLPDYLRTELGKNPDNTKKELVFSKILYELSDALFYIHNFDYENSKGILLRDVKPENIMYDPRIDRCILCDFNIAREYNPKEYWAGTTMIVGTPEYMAPELVAVGGTEKYPNPRQDIYSLGGTIFTLTTRKSLKEEVDSETYKYREISDDQKFNALKKSGLSKEFQNIIYCSIQADPEKRYQEADELYTYVSSLYHSRYFETKYEETLKELKEKKLRNKELVAQISSINADSSKKEKTTKKTLSAAESKIQELTSDNNRLKSDYDSLEKKYEKNKKLLNEYKDKNKKLLAIINNSKIQLNIDEKIILIGFILCILSSIFALVMSIYNPVITNSKLNVLVFFLLDAPIFYYLFSGKYSGKGLLITMILGLTYSAATWLAYIRIPGTYFYIDVLVYICWSLLMLVVSIDYYKILNSKINHISIYLAAIFIIILLFNAFNLNILSTNMNTTIGKHVSLGTYEQDGDEDNGKEALTWKIEGRYDDHYLILSCDNCIEYLPFNDSAEENINWSNSSIKNWLNTDFIYSFSDEESQGIVSFSEKDEAAEYVTLNSYDQVNLFNKMPNPSEYAKQKYDNDATKTDIPWAFTNTYHSNYKGTSIFKAIQPGTTTSCNLDCSANGYIRPLIIVSEDFLKNYIKTTKGE